MNSIVVFGASGQLGHCLKKVAEEKGIDRHPLSASESEANILDKEAIKNVFEKYKPALFHQLRCLYCGR